MWNNKSYWLVMIIILLAFVGVYYGLGDKETRLRNKMIDAVADHEHEEALLYATELINLAKTNPATPIKDAEKVIKESGQLIFYLRAAKSELTQIGASKDDENIDPQELYSGLVSAREYIEKAKKLDPEFENVLDFEETLDEAQKALLYGLALDVIRIGENAVTKASANYENASRLVDLANSSANISTYLAVQSAWPAAAKPNNEAKQELESGLGEMDNMRQLVSEYTDGGAEQLAETLMNYVDSVKDTVDVLSIPQGSFADFTRAADKASKEFNQVQEGLKNSMPKSASITADISKLTKEIAEYKIFEDDSTEQILTDNQSLYQL